VKTNLKYLHDACYNLGMLEKTSPFSNFKSIKSAAYNNLHRQT